VLDLPPCTDCGTWCRRNGQQATGAATIETKPCQRQHSSRRETYENVFRGVAVTPILQPRWLLGSSVQRPCAVTWIPVLTSGPPSGRGITAKDVASSVAGTGRSSDLQSMPLYLYSSEEAVFSAGQPQTTGTVGNGNGCRPLWRHILHRVSELTIGEARCHMCEKPNEDPLAPH